MTKEDLKEFIETKCFTRAGRPGFISKASNESWWIKRDYTTQLNQIKSVTDFYDGNDIPRRCWYVYNGIYDHPKCAVCNSPTNFKNFSGGFYRVCSQECTYKDEQRSRRIVINTDYQAKVEKIKQTNQKRYGVDYNFQLDTVKEKSKQTKFERYGDEFYNNIEANKRTVLENYGSEYWFSSQAGKDYLKSLREKNGGSLKLTPEINQTINNIDYLIELNRTMHMFDMAELLGVTGRTIKLKLESAGHQVLYHPTKWCKLQGKLFDDIVSLYNEEVIFNEKGIIPPKVIDIYVPNKKIAIELNGIYWHSESPGENRKYNHRNRLELCNDKGVSLIQVTDMEYKEQRELVLDLIRSRLGINIKLGARECELRKITNRETRTFLNDNHFQGYVSASIIYGLFFKEELVALMSFGKSRFNKKYDYELLRFAVKNGYNIIGGPQRLFNAFVKEHSPDSIVSYCDLSKFEGNMYYNLGFTLSHRSDPNYFYYKAGKTLSRIKAQKHKLKELLEVFDEKKSESENMFNNGYKRYWDCGNAVFVWTSFC
jgi:very-short-patch-repair endonuclease/predicted nucleic acid-binding Zn ribbon protein